MNRALRIAPSGMRNERITSSQQWQILRERMAFEEKLNPGTYDIDRATPKLLELAYHKGYAHMERAEEQIIRYGALLPTQDPQWREVAQLFDIHGLWSTAPLTYLVASVLAKVQGGGRFLISKRPEVAATVESFGFIEVTHDKLPWGELVISWSKRLGISDRIPPHLFVNAEASDQSRRLFVLPNAQQNA